MSTQVGRSRSVDPKKVISVGETWREIPPPLRGIVYRGVQEHVVRPCACDRCMK